MKKITLLCTFLFTLLFVVPAQSTIINIDVGDFFFSEVSFDAAVGDTIVWTLVAGTHTTTSTLVPSGAATWDYTFTGPADTFTYIITVAGLYEYLCSFHPTTMRGSFATPSLLTYTENFDFPAGDLLAYHGWVNHSGTGTFVPLVAGSLTYTGYPASGIGNHIELAGGGGSREDIHRGFSNVSSGACYAAFLVNVSASDVNDGYVAHFIPPFPTFNYRGRLFMMDDGSGNLKFGISKGSSSIVQYVTANYVYNTTYLLVIKYEYVGDATGTDDIVKLFVNPTLTDPEPTNGDAENIDTASDEELEYFAIRQGSEAHTWQFDGLTVSITWNGLIPVELTSFTAAAVGNSAELKWTTATELNNSGFEVLKSVSDSKWENIGFVQGNGTTAETKYYSFVDNNLAPGSYSYKLKQVDYDGSFEYSDVVNVDIGNPVQFELSQNYPNPFNPNTTINFAIPEAAEVTIKVFNTLGEEVATLVNKNMETGNHTVNFDASGLNSGMYFYKIEAGSFTQVKKMTLLK
ncbi:T9SS type A sorting domain-containing protein [Bacteroidota bacterium]